MVITGAVWAVRPAPGAALTVVPRFVKALNSHPIGLKELFDDVTVGVIELTTQISPSKTGEIAHTIDEKLCVGDAVFLFQFI